MDIAGNQINLLRQLLARILLKQTFEKFTIFQKSEGNGKLLLVELLLDTVGGYGHSIDINNLLNSGKSSGPNPEIAQMHNKLLIVASKQLKQGKFKTSTVKRLTNRKKFFIT